MGHIKATVRPLKHSDERVIEFTDLESGIGGLIALKRLGGGVVVEVYHADPGVGLRLPDGEIYSFGGSRRCKC